MACLGYLEAFSIANVASCCSNNLTSKLSPTFSFSHDAGFHFNTRAAKIRLEGKGAAEGTQQAAGDHPHCTEGGGTRVKDRQVMLLHGERKVRRCSADGFLSRVVALCLHFLF